MATKKEIQTYLEERLDDEEFIQLADGLESAFLGVARQFNRAFAIYDRSRCVAQFMIEGMSLSEAEEWMGYNVEGAYVGESTPAFIDLMPSDWEVKQASALMISAVRCMAAKGIIKDLLRFVDSQKAKNGPEEIACEEVIEAAEEYMALFTKDE